MRSPQTVCAGMAYAWNNMTGVLTWSEERWENRKRITKKGWITIWCIVGVILVALIVLFFIFLWPELNKALVM